jgi:hypothetical protein
LEWIKEKWIRNNDDALRPSLGESEGAVPVVFIEAYRNSP